MLPNTLREICHTLVRQLIEMNRILTEPGSILNGVLDIATNVSIEAELTHDIKWVGTMSIDW